MFLPFCRIPDEEGSPARSPGPPIRRPPITFLPHKDSFHGLVVLADQLRNRRPEPGDRSFPHPISNCYGFRQTQ